jgi:hypothetical protein
MQRNYYILETDMQFLQGKQKQNMYFFFRIPILNDKAK